MVEAVVEAVVEWATDQAGICGVAVVGSYARGTATAESDLDLVILCDEPHELLADGDWVNRFGVCESIEIESYGIVTSIFAGYEWGLEVEFGITPRLWADLPVDDGTARVISDGMKIHYDPEGLLTKAARSVAGLER